MRRIFILLYIISRASMEMQTVQHFFISRKARSNLQPIKSGYVFSQINNEPAKLSTYYDGLSNQLKKKEGKQLVNLLKSEKKKLKNKCIQCFDVKYLNRTDEPINMKDLKDSKLEKSDNLKLAASNMELAYDMSHEFHTDDEDVRTDSRNYDGWPNFYPSLYEYEPMKFDIEYEKAKNKRFVVPDVIPVHENVDDDIPTGQINSGFDHAIMFTTDNPIYGNKPFFSYVLNDYFDKSYDDDPLNFKGISWEEEFDNEKPFQDLYDYPKRIRRLDNNNPHLDGVLGQDSTQESINTKDYVSNHEAENSEKGKDNKRSYMGDYKHNEQNYRGFKDFADAFANRFGSEAHNKVGKYSIKNNADKGEKKKGFRKVYHKDEYQEHNEFFDDKNNSANNEEKGESKVRFGGSEAFLRSQAAAVLGKDKNILNKAKSVANDNYEKNHKSKQHRKGTDSTYNHYRDIEKNKENYFNI